MDQDFLLKAYGALWGPEAGPWNLSVEQKYLEYRITAFFEENFPVARGADICNIGIGAGYWDRYLSYRLDGGSLTSSRMRQSLQAPGMRWWYLPAFTVSMSIPGEAGRHRSLSFTGQR